MARKGSLVLLQQDGVFSLTHVIFCPFFAFPDDAQVAYLPFFLECEGPSHLPFLMRYVLARSRPPLFICLYAVIRTWREEGVY